MTNPADRLYELLPVVHRLRDHEQGEPLHALLQVIAEQVTLVEENIQQMYDNWFIETCEDWVVPYIGDLIGYTTLFEAGEPGDVTDSETQTRNKILIPRREVAKTMRHRRRKGSLALLEELASDVAGLPALAVEFYTLLAWTQHLNHQRSQRGRTVDLRDGNGLELLNSPFDPFAHTVDIRRPNSIHTPGRHNIPGVGLFVWRLKSYPVKMTQACCLEEVGTNCYTFSALGNDTPLYTKPQPEADASEIASEANLPVPIRQRAFEERVEVDGKIYRQAVASLYGQDKSLCIWAANWPAKNAHNSNQPIPRQCIIPADLSEWKYQPRRGQVAVDPLLGRIVFPSHHRPKGGVQVSYHYGFSADMGGGAYSRVMTQPKDAVIFRVVDDPHDDKGEFGTLAEALDPWCKAQPKPPDHAVIEIATNRVYEDRLGPLTLTKPYQTLQIRAANGYRPILRLQNFKVDLTDAWTFRLTPGSHVTLEGLLLYERGIWIEGPETSAKTDECETQAEAEGQEQTESAETTKTEQVASSADYTPTSAQPPAHFTIRHCTLVPGWQLLNDCEPKRPAECSLKIAYVDAQIAIEQSIIGSIIVEQNQVKSEPIAIQIHDSIVDATGSGGEGAESVALSDNDLSYAHAVLTIRDSTVLGKVLTHAIELGENTIFDDPVRVVRSQRGCLRFSYVAPESRTPRRYNCQPDLAKAANGALSVDQQQVRVRPRFNSRRYGTPTYCQLASDCAEEITRGADDESEMGAFHDLYQAQRLANLQVRLDEFTPAGMDAGIILAS